jgi:hypothetical protein
VSITWAGADGVVELIAVVITGSSEFVWIILLFIAADVFICAAGIVGEACRVTGGGSTPGSVN